MCPKVNIFYLSIKYSGKCGVCPVSLDSCQVTMYFRVEGYVHWGVHVNPLPLMQRLDNVGDFCSFSGVNDQINFIIGSMQEKVIAHKPIFVIFNPEIDCQLICFFDFRLRQTFSPITNSAEIDKSEKCDFFGCLLQLSPVSES